MGAASFAASPAASKQGYGSAGSSNGESADQIYAKMSNEEKEQTNELKKRLGSVSNEERVSLINSYFSYAFRNKYRNVLEWMLANNLRPDQAEIDGSVTYVFKYQYNSTDQYLNVLQCMFENNLKPNQGLMNEVFIFCADHNDTQLIKLMLANNLSPNQRGINEVYLSAAASDYSNILKLMLGSNLRPDQNGINKAFGYAALHNYQNIIELMLANNLRPENETIIQEYRKASVYGISQVAQLLQQRFPEVITPEIK